MVATQVADSTSSELSSKEILQIFESEYLKNESPLKLIDYDLKRETGDLHKIGIQAEVSFDGKPHTIAGTGNGPIAAFVSSIGHAGWKNFRLLDYVQKAINQGSRAQAITFIQIQREKDKKVFWGASIDANSELGSLKAVVSAFNRAHKAGA